MDTLSKIGSQIKKYANQKGISTGAYLLRSLLTTLSLTIVGFIIVLILPISPDNVYGWWSGCWQGWFALCNMAIHIVHPATLYRAPLATEAYAVCWWIFFIWGSLTLLGFFIYQTLNFQGTTRMDFVAPEIASNGNSGTTPSNGQSTESEQSSIDGRTIKVFISSTFHDMHTQRDYLMTRIFPQIKEMAALRNVKFIPVDLRWGITEEESRSGKVLELCLQEIDRAIPFFIGIIGQRYGWQPEVEEFSKSEFLKQHYPWIENDLKNHLSVTEIEMQYGVLRREERINAVFFSESTVDATVVFSNNEAGKIANLKRNILQDGRYPIITVPSKDDLGNEVLRIFTEFLDKYFPIPSELDKEATDQGQSNIQDAYQDNLTVEGFISDYLNKFGKKLSSEQTQVIATHPLGQNRRVLKDLLDELVVFGKYEELDNYIAFWLESEEPVQFYEKVLERAEKKYGKGEVKRFFIVLRRAQNGISVDKLLKRAQIESDYTRIEIKFSLAGIISFFKDLGVIIWNEFNETQKRKPYDQYFKEYLRREGNLVFLDNPYMAQAIDKQYAP